MSFFKDKDDLFTKHFQGIANEESDSDDEDDKSISDNIETESKIEDITFNEDDDDYDQYEESPLKKLKTDVGSIQSPLKTDVGLIQSPLKTHEVKESKDSNKNNTTIKSNDTGNDSIECLTIDDCDTTNQNNNNNNYPDNIPLALRKGKRKCVKKKIDDVVIVLSDEEDNNNIPDTSIAIVVDNISTDQNKPLNEQKQIDNDVLNNSQDNDDYRFNLKITIAGAYKQFATTYKTKLSSALKDFLNQLREENKGLIIRSSLGHTIPLDESPYSLELTPGVILEAIEISLNDNKQNDSIGMDPNKIRVKVQDGNRKNTKEFVIPKNEPLLSLKESYAKEINLPSVEGIKFCFDGDIVDDESTPTELDIDDDCVIDVMFSN